MFERIFIKKIINILYFIFQITLIGAFINKKDYFGIAGTIAVFIFYLLFLFYEHKNGILISNFIRFSVLVSVLANSFVGEYMKLYKTSVYFDKGLHIFGTFSFTLFIVSIAGKKGVLQGLRKSLIFIFLILIGTFIGNVFEIVEFISDLIFKTANQGNLIDTNLDIIFNILGAILSGAYVLYQMKISNVNQ